MSNEIRLLPLVDEGCGCGPSRDHAAGEVSRVEASGSTYRLAGLTHDEVAAAVSEAGYRLVDGGTA